MRCLKTNGTWINMCVCMHNFCSCRFWIGFRSAHENKQKRCSCQLFLLVLHIHSSCVCVFLVIAIHWKHSQFLEASRRGEIQFMWEEVTAQTWWPWNGSVSNRSWLNWFTASLPGNILLYYWDCVFTFDQDCQYLP